MLGVLTVGSPLYAQDDDDDDDSSDAPPASSQNQEAIDTLTQAIDANPQSGALLRKRGYAYLSGGNYAKAILDLNHAIEIEPTNPDGYRLRGFCYLRQGDADQAIENYSRTIEYRPQAAIAFARRAQAELLKGDLDDAKGDLDHATRLSPTGAQGSVVYLVAGRAWRDFGDYDKSLADLAHAVQLDAGNAPAYNHLSWLLATCPRGDLRDGAKAVEDAQTACVLTHWQVPAMLDTLAAAYAESGDFKSAVLWESKFLESPHLAVVLASGGAARLALYKAHEPYRSANNE